MSDKQETSRLRYQRFIQKGGVWLDRITSCIPEVHKRGGMGQSVISGDCFLARKPLGRQLNMLTAEVIDRLAHYENICSENTASATENKCGYGQMARV